MPTPFAVSGGTHATTALHYKPTQPSGTVFVLAHGAGAGQQHPFMVAMAEGLASRGVDAVTFNFPYVEAGRRLPDKAPVLEACFGAVVQAARARATSGRPRLVIGGKSMGGRMATHLGAADAIPGLAGIVALGYPLHPPGKPQQLRAAHLPHIAVPVLLVQGERDTFGGPSELQPVIETMRAPVTLHVMPGGDHSFVSRAAPCGAVYEVILDVMVAWIERLDA